MRDDAATLEIAAPHAVPVDAVLTTLAVDPARGLDGDEIEARRARFGRNRLPRADVKSLARILLDQLRSLLVWLLVAAAILSFAVGDAAEGVAVLLVVVLNTGIGFFTELRATRSMEALRRMASVQTRVRRGGATVAVDAVELVPGDVVVLEAGDVITADVRLLRAATLAADESVLTGESAPVAKTLAPLPSDTPLADRTNMAFKGCSLTQGAGEAVVVATGPATELGRISRLAQEAAPQTSPLERRLDRLGARLIWLTLAIVTLTGAIGVAQGRDVVEMVETAIALAVAAVPEGLPVVATLCLARGMLRMASRRALISRLSAVETLGATTIVLTDKTGTLTENQMTATLYLLDGASVEIDDDPATSTDDPQLQAALRIGALCTNAELSAVPDVERRELGVGDPMELALLDAARRCGLDPSVLQAATPELEEHAFDPELKIMATVHRTDDGALIAVKGAPETVISRATRRLGPAGEVALSDADRADWLARAQDAASRGYRVLGLALRRVDDPTVPPYEDLTLVGLVCLVDPLRADVPEAIAACRRAGLRVVMLTGDHADTAAEIARQAGLGAHGFTVIEGRTIAGFDPDTIGDEARARLLGVDVFARVSPETKLKLARLHQSDGQIIAMTGDGVNDAPALRQADIGVAMGQRGSEVAREAADIVLQDDAFPTLAVAVREGRVIFDNIRKFVVYLMSCNLSEVLIVGAAVAVGLPTPLAPLQILFLNLVTDVFPAFALGLGEGDDGVMRRPPRPPSEPILDRPRWRLIGVLGVLITIATLTAFLIALNRLALPTEQAITVAFITLALAQLWNVFNMRDPASGALANEVTRNLYIWCAVAGCIGMVGAALWIPAMAEIMRLPWPGSDGALLAVGLSALPLIVGQILMSIGAFEPEPRDAPEPSGLSRS